MPLLSARIWKLRLQFGPAHLNRTSQVWKCVSWSDSDGRIIIWCKQHEWIHPADVQAVGVGVIVWGIFSWHSLGLLVPTEHHSDSTSCFQQDDTPSHKAKINTNYLNVEFTALKWAPQSPDPNPFEALCDVVDKEIRIVGVQLTNLQHHVSVNQNL